MDTATPSDRVTYYRPSQRPFGPEVSPLGLTALPAASFMAPVGVVVVLPLDSWLEHGPALVRAAPVARVELLDAPPLYVRHRGRPVMERWAHGYGLSREGGSVGDGYLPAALFARLPPGDAAGEGLVSYRSRRLAADALSAACLAWARSVEAPA